MSDESDGHGKDRISRTIKIATTKKVHAHDMMILAECHIEREDDREFQ